MILHHITKNKGAPPKPTKPIAYKDWNSSRCNWVELEQNLSASATAPTAESPPGVDGEYELDQARDGDGEATESE